MPNFKKKYCIFRNFIYISFKLRRLFRHEKICVVLVKHVTCYSSYVIKFQTHETVTRSL